MLSLSPVLDGNVGSGSGEYDMMWCGEMGLGWSGGRGILVSLFRVCAVLVACGREGELYSFFH